MGTIGRDIILPSLNLTLINSEALLKGVTPGAFARMPNLGGRAIVTNHPAFVLGHLSLYAGRVLAMTDQPVGPAAAPENYESLFKQGVQCQDDPEGTIYPAMDSITSQYFTAYRAVAAALPEIPDAAFAKPSPLEGRFKELLPTVGGLAAFLCGAHAMLHLGQISGWRRCMGLGSAM